VSHLLLFDQLDRVNSRNSQENDKAIILIQSDEMATKTKKAVSPSSDLFLVSLLSCELFQFSDLFEADLFLCGKAELKKRPLLGFRIIIEGFELVESLDFVKR
jgi:hypothetical protein